MKLKEGDLGKGRNRFKGILILGAVKRALSQEERQGIHVINFIYLLATLFLFLELKRG